MCSSRSGRGSSISSPRMPRPRGRVPMARCVSGSMPAVTKRSSSCRRSSSTPTAAYRAPVTSRATSSSWCSTASTSSLAIRLRPASIRRRRRSSSRTGSDISVTPGDSTGNYGAGRARGSRGGLRSRDGGRPRWPHRGRRLRSVHVRTSHPHHVTARHRHRRRRHASGRHHLRARVGPRHGRRDDGGQRGPRGRPARPTTVAARASSPTWTSSELRCATAPASPQPSSRANRSRPLWRARRSSRPSP